MQCQDITHKTDTAPRMFLIILIASPCICFTSQCKFNIEEDLIMSINQNLQCSDIYSGHEKSAVQMSRDSGVTCRASAFYKWRGECVMLYIFLSYFSRGGDQVL